MKLKHFGKSYLSTKKNFSYNYLINFVQNVPDMNNDKDIKHTMTLTLN